MKPSKNGSATNINDTDLTLSLSCLWLNSAATELVIKRQRDFYLYPALLMPVKVTVPLYVCVCKRMGRGGGWGVVGIPNMLRKLNREVEKERRGSVACCSAERATSWILKLDFTCQSSSSCLDLLPHWLLLLPTLFLERCEKCLCYHCVTLWTATKNSRCILPGYQK